MRLTTKLCQGFQPKNKTYKKSDGKGLYLQIEPSGGKYWRMNYTFAQKQKTLPIGTYPEVSLNDARIARDAAKLQIKSGLDPMLEKKRIKVQQAIEGATSFEHVAREWFEFTRHKWATHHAAMIIDRLEKNVFRFVGKMPIKDVTAAIMLEDVVQRMTERGAHDVARRIVNFCAHIYRYAIAKEYVETNVAETVKPFVAIKPVGHFASIEVHELPQFLADLEKHRDRLHPQTYLAMHLMMLTFMRTKEMIMGRWSELDHSSDQWLIPRDRMKMKRDHIVPLSYQSICILDKLRKLHAHPKYIFPGFTKSNTNMSNNTLLMALDRMGYRGKMTGHGFRSLAMTTIMEKLHYRFEVPDLQLAHQKRGVRKSYDRSQFLDERTRMMQDWADYLDKLRGYPIIG